MKVEKARELSMDIAKQKIAWKFDSFFFTNIETLKTSSTNR